MFGVGLFFVLKYWQGIILGLGVALIVGAIFLLVKMVKKWYNMKKGLKLNVSRVKKEDANEDDAVNGVDEKHSNLKSTEKGYVNKNNQKNLGKTDKEGTDNNQYFYEMECLNCGHKCYANGTDIWQRKCPACQNGRK